MSALILILIFISLKKSAKSSPILKHVPDRENYNTPDDSHLKSRKKNYSTPDYTYLKNKKNIKDNEKHHHQQPHHDKPLKKSHSKENLTESTQIPFLENMQLRNSRISEGKVNGLIDTEGIEEKKLGIKNVFSSDKIGGQFLNDLLILLFIGTVCLTLVLLLSWAFYNQARKIRKQNPDIESQESESSSEYSEPSQEISKKLLKESETHSQLSKLLKKSNSNHDQNMLVELVDILTSNVDIPSVREESDETQNNEETVSREDLRKIERLTTVSLSSEEENKHNKVSIPDLPQYLIERKKEVKKLTFSPEVLDKGGQRCSPEVPKSTERVYPTEQQQQQLVYHAMMDNYRNDVIIPTLHFLGKDVSTSTEDLSFLDKADGIKIPLSEIKIEKEPNLCPPKEVIEKAYFLHSEIRNNDSRTSVSVQTADPNDNSVVRNVKFSGEVTVKYYLVNQPIHAFEKRKKRHKAFEIREVVESYPMKRKEGLGKCKTMKRPAKLRETKTSFKSMNHFCKCYQKE